MEDLLKHDVFQPLEMNDTSFWVPAEKRSNVVVPAIGVSSMVDWDFTSTFNPYPHLVHSNNSAGGIFTTAKDLAKFVHRVLLSPNSTILSNRQVREWLSPLYVFEDHRTAVGYIALKSLI
jgi:CubicO group peptidase (beta-lactamase class C family)